MSYAYKRGKETPPFVPFNFELRPGERIEKGNIITADTGPLRVKRITSVEALATGARVIGKGLPK